MSSVVSASPSPAPVPRKAIPLTCSGHTRPVVHLEFSGLQDDGTYLLLSSCKDGNPMLRDWLGDWIGTFIGHKGAVWSAKLSGGDAARAVTGSADFTAKVWDTYTGAPLHTFSHEHIVRTVAISTAGDRILTGGHEKKLRLFDLNRPDADPVLFFNPASSSGGGGAAGGAAVGAPGTNGATAAGGLAHSGTIKSVVWERGANEGRSAVSAGEDKAIRWWDLRTQAMTHEMVLPDPITSMERSSGPAFGEILTVTTGKDVLFIDAESRQIRRKWTLPQAPSSASLHPTLADRFIAGSVGDGWVRIYDYETGVERELHKGHHGPVHCVSYSPDGEVGATGSEDGTIRLWQTYPGKKYGLWEGVPGGLAGGANGAPPGL